MSARREGEVVTPEQACDEADSVTCGNQYFLSREIEQWQKKAEFRPFRRALLALLEMDFTTQGEEFN